MLWIHLFTHSDPLYNDRGCCQHALTWISSGCFPHMYWLSFNLYWLWEGPLTCPHYFAAASSAHTLNFDNNNEKKLEVMKRRLSCRCCFAPLDGAKESSNLVWCVGFGVCVKRCKIQWNEEKSGGKGPNKEVQPCYLYENKARINFHRLAVR